MPVSSETALAIAYAHREIEAAEKLLEDVDAAIARSSFDQKDIRDAFGRRQDGLQLGVPSGNGGHRLFNVPFTMCRPIIEAHIANQKTIVRLYSEKAGIEAMSDDAKAVPTMPVVKQGEHAKSGAESGTPSG